MRFISSYLSRTALLPFVFLDLHSFCLPSWPYFGCLIGRSCVVCGWFGEVRGWFVGGWGARRGSDRSPCLQGVSRREIYGGSFQKGSPGVVLPGAISRGPSRDDFQGCYPAPGAVYIQGRYPGVISTGAMYPGPKGTHGITARNTTWGASRGPLDLRTRPGGRQPCRTRFQPQ